MKHLLYNTVQFVHMKAKPMSTLQDINSNFVQYNKLNKYGRISLGNATFLILDF